MKFLLIQFFGFFVHICSSARILSVIPTASYSHQIPFRAIWRSLLARGHHITLITANPINDPTLKNLTEIDTSFAYEIFKRENLVEYLMNDEMSALARMSALRRILRQITIHQFKLPAIQRLLTDKNQHFDLMFSEMGYPGLLAYSWHFQCPFILITTLEGTVHDHYYSGNPTHPIANPDYNLHVENVHHMTFWERFQSFLYRNLHLYYAPRLMFEQDRSDALPFFSPALPSLVDIYRNISLMFVNSNSVMFNVRATGPQTIFIGDGIHIKAAQPLPQELEEFMNSSTAGVIYFSLGTNVRNHHFPSGTFKAILEALSELPHHVLWKFDQDVDELKTLPNNILIREWFPQQDILRHPNVKLFITHGGIQSIQEALLNGIPMIGIPFYGDQIYNVNKMVVQGCALRIQRRKISKFALINATTEIIHNHKYRQKAKELGNIMKDEPMSGLDKAIWWTEYVLRHKGATHLRNPIADLPLYQFYFIDILVAIIFTMLSVLLTIYFLVKWFIQKIKWSIKLKQA